MKILTLEKEKKNGHTTLRSMSLHGIDGSLQGILWVHFQGKNCKFPYSPQAIWEKKQEMGNKCLWPCNCLRESMEGCFVKMSYIKIYNQLWRGRAGRMRAELSFNCRNQAKGKEDKIQGTPALGETLVHERLLSNSCSPKIPKESIPRNQSKYSVSVKFIKLSHHESLRLNLPRYLQ